jgi:hypothetical protein
MAEDKGTRLDPNWEPSSTDLAYAVQWGINSEYLLEEFRGYWCAKAGAAARKVSWSLTWQEWCRRKGKRPMPPVEEKKPDLFTRPKGGRTLAEIHRVYGEAWAAITRDTLRTLSDDIDMAASELEEGDRAHFHSLVAAEVQSLSSPLAQAIAQGRERPPFPYDRLDWQALRDRTESQMHSTAGYEGRKNMTWWRERYPERYGRLPKPAPIALQPAREIPPGEVLAFRNPNSSGGFRNPNAA